MCVCGKETHDFDWEKHLVLILAVFVAYGEWVNLAIVSAWHLVLVASLLYRQRYIFCRLLLIKASECLNVNLYTTNLMGGSEDNFQICPVYVPRTLLVITTYHLCTGNDSYCFQLTRPHPLNNNKLYVIGWAVYVEVTSLIGANEAAWLRSLHSIFLQRACVPVTVE